MDTYDTIENKNEIKMEDCIIINRISSQRQDEGYSLPQQSKLNNEVALRSNCQIIKEFDIIESAKNSEKRDEFHEAINFIKKHRNIRHVFLEKTDRLTRNLYDNVLAYNLVYNHNITFHFSRDNQILSKESKSHEKLMFDMKSVIAKNYIDNLSEEVKKGQRGMLEEGKWPGGASPTGYKKVEKLLVPDSPRDKYIARTFKLYASGVHSLKSLKKALDKNGFRSRNGKLLTLSNYFIILTNPIYYGMMKWNNKLYLGIHEPILEKPLFDKVQELLHRTKNGELIPIYQKHDFTYRNVMACGECGCKITAEEKKKTNKGNGYVHKWIYYHCTHFKPCNQTGCVREEKIEKEIMELLSSLHIAPNTTEWLKKMLRESHKEEVTFRENAFKTLNICLTQLNTKLDSLYDDKLANKIDEESYERKRQQFILEREDIKYQIARHEKADDLYKDFGCLVLDVANRASEIYQVRNSEEKRYLLNFVFSNLNLMNKNLKFGFKSIFESIVEYQKLGSELGSLDSNLKHFRNLTD